MVELNEYKKAELLSAAKKVGLPAASKDTKKSLMEKLEAFIAAEGEKAAHAVDAALDIDTDEEEVEDDEEEVSTLAGDDDNDDEYKGPPIDIKAKVIDPIIDFSEQYYSKFLEFTDCIGATTLDYNDELRENLSTTISLNYLELGLEFAYFFYTYVTFVPIKDNATIPSILKENFDVLTTCSCAVPDFTTLVSCKTISIFLNWFVYSVLIPLFISYYVNFSRRIIVADNDTGIVARIYKFDPFIFSLFKVLIFYFITKNAGTLTTLHSYSGILKALQTQFLIQLGFYKEFTALLGNFPLIVGVANVAIGLYSQFEDF